MIIEDTQPRITIPLRNYQYKKRTNESTLFLKKDLLQ